MYKTYKKVISMMKVIFFSLHYTYVNMNLILWEIHIDDLFILEVYGLAKGCYVIIWKLC